MDREQIEQIAYQAMSRRKAHLYREKGFVYRHGKRVAELSLNLRRRLFPENASTLYQVKVRLSLTEKH